MDSMIYVGTKRFRGFLKLLLCFVVLLLVSDCSRPHKDGGTETAITIGTFGDERIFFQDYWGMEASFMLFLPLVKVNYENGSYEGYLAEYWEHSEDYRTWTFHLRDDITWHDGVPVTAHDIKFSFELRNHDRIKEGLELSYTVSVLDDYTVQFVYPDPIDGLASAEWTVYYPEHLLEHLDPEIFYEWDFWENPVGNGPFRYLRHLDKTMVEVEANSDYFRGKPAIDRAILKFTEPSLTELYSSNVDVLTYVSPDFRLKLKEDEPYNLYSNWGSTINAICWNHNHPLFQSGEVRRALTMAIDRKGLARLMNYPEEIPVTDGYALPGQYLKKKYAPNIGYDPEEARKILAGIGWEDTNGDGVLDREGQDFRFTVKTGDVFDKQMIYVKENLRNIGVEMNLSIMDISLLRRSFFETGDFESITMATRQSLYQPNYGILRLMGADSPINYNKEEMQTLLERMRQAPPPEQDELYRKLNLLFRKDMPITFLLPRVTSHIVRSDIKGLKDGIKTNPIEYLENLRIE